MNKRPNLSPFTWLIFLFSLFLLSACETSGKLQDDADFSSRTVKKCDEPIALSGRISMHYTLSKNDKTESLHGKFSWEQADDITHIRLFSPLGQTMAVMAISPKEAIFTASGRPPVTAPNADELVFQQLGWPLPISGMHNWLQGCAIDSSGQTVHASPAQPAIFTRDGWQIRYIDWLPFGENELLPKRIDMEHTPMEFATVSAINIRLIIDEWQMANP